MLIVVTDEIGTLRVRKTTKGGSSNIAELWAVAEAMLHAKKEHVSEIEVFTDSQNNLAWLKGNIGKKLNDRNAVMNLLTAIDNNQHGNSEETGMALQKVQTPSALIPHILSLMRCKTLDDARQLLAEHTTGG